MDMRTWRDSSTRADSAATALREALAALGLPESTWGSIRPRVVGSGAAYVHVGMVRADAVEQIAQALGGPPRPAAEAAGEVALRWLDTGSGPGAMVPVRVSGAGSPSRRP